MDACARAGRMQDDAGEGMAVVGQAGALIGCRCGRDSCGGGRDARNSRFGLAGGENSEAEGGELRAKAAREDEGEVFFKDRLAGGCDQMRAGVVATVGRIEEDEGVVQGGSDCWLRGGLRVLSSGGKEQAEQGEMAGKRCHVRC